MDSNTPIVRLVDLPCEVLSQILTHLHEYTAHILRFVCKVLHRDMHASYADQIFPQEPPLFSRNSSLFIEWDSPVQVWTWAIQSGWECNTQSLEKALLKGNVAVFKELVSTHHVHADSRYKLLDLLQWAVRLKHHAIVNYLVKEHKVTISCEFIAVMTERDAHTGYIAQLLM